MLVLIKNVRNSGSTTISLSLAFEAFSSDRRYSSTNPITVIPEQGWQTIVFPIDENSLTNITTCGLGYNSTFNNVKDNDLVLAHSNKFSQMFYSVTFSKIDNKKT